MVVTFRRFDGELVVTSVASDDSFDGAVNPSETKRKVKYFEVSMLPCAIALGMMLISKGAPGSHVDPDDVKLLSFPSRSEFFEQERFCVKKFVIFTITL